ncbi:MAG: Taurine catabolism dioxygenase TauD, TfdA family [Candidatus Gallionella acididurans]|uniref:Taurine catabolism dioxygenase TauD, TfdA family n=1 Tax=Candidatus Gallionella acididurans TaxID=1796491 RepID=A0A139BVV9_9PROT|nr:MAG: Taurine catabolism dioxygenase TauD, TfdA family [Candidatus Gallionella acididurans]
MQNPFDLDNPAAYLHWRDRKLARAICGAGELVVEVNKPDALTVAEHAALLDRCQRGNMAIYASHAAADEDTVRRFGLQFGLASLDANWLAGEQGITRVTVCADDGQRQAYIPYTDRAIKWHTDGYYNPPERLIRGMVMHCVQSAGQGGGNRLLDHEIAYLMLRDENSDFIRALSAADAMTIPERTDEQGVARAAQTGPVFSVDPASGTLHMRYTARTRSIIWKQDAATLEAVAALEKLLASALPHIHSVTLEPGMGLLCNNVLHDRAAFSNEPDSPRLLFRARYHERIAAS